MTALLTKDIQFKNYDGETIVLEQDSEIIVDSEEGIAYAQGYHFDIDKSEYIVIN